MKTSTDQTHLHCWKTQFLALCSILRSRGSAVVRHKVDFLALQQEMHSFPRNSLPSEHKFLHKQTPSLSASQVIPQRPRSTYFHATARLQRHKEKKRKSNGKDDLHKKNPQKFSAPKKTAHLTALGKENLHIPSQSNRKLSLLFSKFSKLDASRGNMIEWRILPTVERYKFVPYNTYGITSVKCGSVE